MVKLLSLLAVGLTLLLASCDGDEEQRPTEDTSTPTATITGSPVEEGGLEEGISQGIVEAVANYVGSTGLDGDTFELTDPFECGAITLQVEAAETEAEEAEILQGTAGEVCLSEGKSDVRQTAADIYVAVYATEASWKLTLERQDGGWQVTGVEYTGL